MKYLVELKPQLILGEMLREWATFGDAFNISADSSDLTYYDKYELDGFYWSSTQADTDRAYIPFFGYSFIGDYGLTTYGYIHLATTF